MIFPEDVKLFGVSVNSTPAPGLRIFGEASYRPNQPLGINASDLIAAFLTRAPLSALNLAKNTNAIAPGGTGSPTRASAPRRCFPRRFGPTA